MAHAFRMMCISNNKYTRVFKINSRLYENLKTKAYHTTYDEEFSEKIRKTKMGELNPNFGKFGKDNPNFGSKRTDIQKKHMSDVQKNYFKTHKKISSTLGRKSVYNVELDIQRFIYPEELASYLSAGWI